MSLILTIGILLDLFTAAWFLVVALALQYRIQGVGPLPHALRLSMFFWYGAAGFMILDGGYAAYVLNYSSPPLLQLGVLLLRRTLFVVGTGFLVHLLLVMATGNERHWGWLGAYYAVVTLVMEAITFYQQPTGHEPLVWSIQFMYARQTPIWVNLISGALIFVPLAAAAIMALRHYKTMPTRADRFRLAVLCYSILSFVAGVLIGFVDNTWFWYGLFENRLVFAIALGMWLVLYPPWLARRMGVPILRDIKEFPSVLRKEG